MATSNGSKLTPAASTAFGFATATSRAKAREQYSINGKPASSADAEVMEGFGLPLGDYWGASNFVSNLRTASKIGRLPRIYIHTSTH